MGKDGLDDNQRINDCRRRVAANNASTVIADAAHQHINAQTESEANQLSQVIVLTCFVTAPHNFNKVIVHNQVRQRKGKKAADKADRARKRQQRAAEEEQVRGQTRRLCLNLKSSTQGSR